MPANNTTTGQRKNDDRTWISGAKPQYEAISLRVHNDRVYLGIKGWDVRHKANGYISIPVPTEGLHELVMVLGSILGLDFGPAFRED